MELYKNKEWLTQKYRVEEMHVNEIAKLAGCANTTAMKWIKKLGIKLWEKGTSAIYLTRKEIEKVALPSQKIDTLAGWNLPNLFVLHDNLDIIRPFVERLARLWSRYFDRTIYVSQIDHKVYVAQHWYKMTQMGRGEKRGPRVRIYDIKPRIDYEAYISSDEWAGKSKALRGEIGKCQLCGGNPDLGHHNTYNTLSKEGPYDVTVLCFRCHTIFHKSSRVRRDFKNRPIVLTHRDGYDIMAPPSIPQDISKG